MVEAKTWDEAVNFIETAPGGTTVRVDNCEEFGGRTVMIGKPYPPPEHYYFSRVSDPDNFDSFLDTGSK